MAEYDKGRYYWIKLTDRFMTSDTVDFLMSQKDGANYVVLYQMLCLKTINNDGLFVRRLGEIIIPYDIDKIQRDCKWFPIDTVRIALELYKSLGLVYENNDGYLAISDFGKLIGSQTLGAEKKQIQRAEDKCPPKCPPEKDIKRLRDRNKDIDIEEKNIQEKKSAKKREFIPPTFEEVLAYAKEKDREDIARAFFDYFDIGEWVDSKGTKVRNWKQKFLTWCGNNEKKKGENNETDNGDYKCKLDFGIHI